MPPHGTGSGTETATTTVFSFDGWRSRNGIKNLTDRRGFGGGVGGVRKGRTRPDRTLLLMIVLVLMLSFSGECKGVKRKHGLGRAGVVGGNVTVSNQHSYHHHQMRSRPVAAMGKEEDYIAKGKICIGTHGRMSVPSNRDHHYRNMKDRYTNCTYVDGNLELSWLQDPTKDLDFAKDIREVTGYVQISHVDVKRIVLPNLQIIRGRTRFKMNPPDEDEYSLIITLNKVESVELPALREIQKGSVGIINNYNLCHIRTIDWKEIISDPEATAVYVYNFTSSERECSPCHKSCMRGCWGDGPENCQKFSKITCSPQCAGGRCYGPEPRQCCHLFCAGGCTGPTQNECIACKNFYDDGVCTSDCPPMQIYDPATYSWKENPNGKYAYGATCVKKCPEHLLKDNGACVRVCPPNKKAQDGECVLCDGPCPKSCVGDTTVHSGNIDSFRGCTVIEGYLNILENSFKGFQQVYPNYTFGDRYPEMHPDRLEVFSTLKELTGYLNIQAYDTNFRNLSYFRNLEIIHGRVLHEYSSSLYIVKSSLESLELKSLRKINMGTVVILENKDMCFAEDINWEKLRKSHEHSLMLSNNSDPKSCKSKGLVCDPQCSRDGCWGPGPDQCLSCAHFKLGNRCLLNCSVEHGIYRANDYECKPCHPQCGLACNGPGATNCTTCKNFKDGPFCVEKCPDGKYEENGVCRKCHENCVDGCTGPKNTIGPGGCNSCALAIMNENATVDTCLNQNETCPDGYYFEYVGPQVQEERALKSLSGKAICRKCHPRCKKCTGYGFHELICQECTKYKKGEQCEDECAQDHYPDIATHVCIACDPECRGCTGPGPDNCVVCQNFKLYDNGNIEQNNTFRCVSVCPPDFPHRMFPENEAFCSNVPVISAIVTPKNSTYVVVIAVGSVGAVVALLVFTVLIYCQRKEKLKANAMKMTMAMALNNIEDNEPLRPSNIPPNTAHLRIINETELRRGSTLGYGAFGVVYKGFWMLDGERQHKIPVAIKVLRKDATTNNSKEFLSEAHIMASIDHPNLLRLLAVCMTSENMLITQLMGLGCLLDFVRKKRDDIGSQTMLSWCTQIARGMAYLEEKRLVHRDLAARNVLVQNANCVKITDFGLAKLLDTNEEEYKAAGGKMPIKWLALECIQHRRFTHKSDVWAFGVTVWEILTFGERPYPKTPAREVPELLEKGERLPQPEIATIDVYMIMIKCWMLESESRPCFKELEDDFSKMSLDPGRYLIIPGDRYLKVPAGTNTLMSDRDMVRSLASENVDITESDDYLHRPKSRAPFHGTGLTSLSGAISGSPIPDKYCRSSQPVVSDGSSAYPNSQNQFNHRLMRYNQRHLDPSIHGTQSDVSSAKYCGADEIGSDEYDSSDRPKLVQVVTLKLPVDEDDYLIPSPQHSQGPSTYLDLNKTTDQCASNPNVFQNYSELFQNNIDNPEYLMNNEAPLPPTQTVGLPDVSNFTVPPSPGTADTVKGSFALPRSSEEESDHECYDFDRLKRELQPLQKNKDGAIV